MNSGEWKHDPRLAGMDPVKLQYIEKIAAQVSSQSKRKSCPPCSPFRPKPGKTIFPSLTRKQRS